MQGSTTKREKEGSPGNSAFQVCTKFLWLAFRALKLKKSGYGCFQRRLLVTRKLGLSEALFFARIGTAQRAATMRAIFVVFMLVSHILPGETEVKDRLNGKKIMRKGRRCRREVTCLKILQHILLIKRQQIARLHSCSIKNYTA
jgi:hypothetical protein